MRTPSFIRRAFIIPRPFHSLLMLLPMGLGCSVSAPAERPLEAPIMTLGVPCPDDWDRLPACDVLVGTIQEASDRVTVQVERVLTSRKIPSRITLDPIGSSRKGEPVIPWTFQKGERWILFLEGAATPPAICLGREHPAELQFREPAVKQGLAFLALRDDQARCRFLVSRIVEGGYALAPAARLLPRFNTALHLPLLAPLAVHDFGKRTYWSMLSTNPHPEALPRLRALILQERMPLQLEAFRALSNGPFSEAVARELLIFLAHPEASIREEAVLALRRRNVTSAQPMIALRLWDESSTVRQAALTWPWRDYVLQHPDVKVRIQALQNDYLPQTAQAAREALQQMQR